MVSFTLPKQRCEGGSVVIPLFQVKTFRLWFISNLGSECWPRRFELWSILTIGLVHLFRSLPFINLPNLF